MKKNMLLTIVLPMERQETKSLHLDLMNRSDLSISKVPPNKLPHLVFLGTALLCVLATFLGASSAFALALGHGMPNNQPDMG